MEEPNELKRMKAFLTYLNCNTFKEVSQETDESQYHIQNWAKEENWIERRKKHFKMVQEQMVDSQQRLAHKQALLANQVVDRLSDMISVNLDEVEIRSVSDLWEAFATGIEALQSLTGTQPVTQQDNVLSQVNINLDSSEKQAEFDEIMDGAYEELERDEENS